VLVKIVYAAGRALAGLASFAIVLIFVVSTQAQTQGTPWLAPLWVIALALIGLPATVAVHEAGHLLACLALRVRVHDIQLGNGKPPRLRFTVGGVEVSLGAPYTGRVLHATAPSAGRGALISAAGPLANLIAAAALFSAGQRGNLAAAAAQFAVGHVGNVGVIGLALLMTRTGVQNLLPYRTRAGRFSDGARLLALAGGPFARALRPRDASGWLPLAGTAAALHAEYKEMLRHPGSPLAPEQATRWLRAYWQREPLAWLVAGIVGKSLRLEGRITELLALHADLPLPSGPHARQLTVTTHMLDWEVLLVPGLPASAVDQAAGRVEWVLGNDKFQPPSTLWNREAVLHTLALGRLRQGRFAEAEELCRPALARPDLPASSRATVLATLVLARRAAGLPYERELAEARFLDRGADLVAEATGARQFQGA
jgi:hypothetical protein